LDGEQIADLCHESGISRKAGYKIFDHYRDHRLEADRSPRPARYANQFPERPETIANLFFINTSIMWQAG
jgi:hypothetical protein